MANIGVGDTIQITAVGSYCGQTTMNTFPHIVTAITGGPVTHATFFAALNTAWNAAGKLWDMYIKCPPINWEFRQAWYQVVRPVRFRAVKIAHTDVGSFTDTPGLTANVQGSITRFGELSNRHDIGAVRIPLGTDDSCFDDGELTPAQKTALEGLGVQMAAVTTAAGVTIRPLTGLVAATYSPGVVEGTIVQETVRVIRRRTVRVGI